MATKREDKIRVGYIMGGESSGQYRVVKVEMLEGPTCWTMIAKEGGRTFTGRSRYQKYVDGSPRIGQTFGWTEKELIERFVEWRRMKLREAEADVLDRQVDVARAVAFAVEQGVDVGAE